MFSPLPTARQGDFTGPEDRRRPAMKINQEGLASFHLFCGKPCGESASRSHSLADFSQYLKFAVKMGERHNLLKLQPKIIIQFSLVGIICSNLPLMRFILNFIQPVYNSRDFADTLRS
jgi:hypothetical protein